MEVLLKNIFALGCFIASLNSFAAFNTNSQIHFPSVDVFKLHNQDQANEKLGTAPRFAIEHNVNIDLKNFSLNKKASNLIATYRVKADNAVSLNLAFDFKMTKNSKVKIYASDFSTEMRSFTILDNNIDNEIWTPVIMANDIIVEVSAPSNEYKDIQFHLKQINQGYRTFGQSTEKSGSCNVDVACTESVGWESEVNSVGVISTGGSTFCTGFMVNNTKNDKTPFFMTANHCSITKTNAKSLVVYWNFQTSKCGGNRDGKLTDFNTGAQFLASSAKSDFALVRLNKVPRPEWNVTYAGWDRSGQDALHATAIHHPATDEKSISFENDPTTITSYLGDSIPGDSTHVRIENWDIGTTEPGSSGSPLFDQNHRIIGQLHGGYASCSSKTSDWYGRIYTSWEGEGNANSRLKDWLDSDNLNHITTDTL